MKEYDLSSIINFLECPLKYKLQSELGHGLISNLSSQTVITSALSDTYLKFCHLFAQGKSFSVQERAKHFSKVWDRLRKEFEQCGGQESRAHALLMATHSKIINMTKPVASNWDISVVDYKTERAFKDYIITDTLDLVLVNKKDTKYIELVFLDKGLSKESETDIGLMIRAIFNLFYFKNNLMGAPDINIRCIVLNLHHGYRKRIVFNPEVVKKYKSLIHNVIDSIEKDLYYPHSTVEGCKHCTFKNSCIFSRS